MDEQKVKNWVIVQNLEGIEVFRKQADSVEIANIETYVRNCKKWYEGKIVYIRARLENAGF